MSVSASLIVLVALVSFVAAVRLATQSRELKFALSQTSIAKTQAEENLREAERQRSLAEGQTLAAEQSRLAADSARKEAEVALAREQDARQVAQKAIDDAEMASEAQRVAVADSEMARSELQSATETNRSLQYNESLVKANNLIRRGENTEARSILNGCDRDQCGWEWRWLMTQTKSKSSSVTKLNTVPKAMMAKLTLPAPSYITYDASRESLAQIDVPDPPHLSLSPDRSIAVFARMDSAAQQTRARSQGSSNPNAGLIPPMHSLVKVDLGFATSYDVAAGFYSTTHVRMLDDTGLAMILSNLPKVGLDGQRTYEFVMQIWDTRSPMRKLLQEALSNGFLPSVVHFSKRKLLLGCIQPNELVSWKLEQGERLARIKLDFSVKNGPDSIRLLPSGEVAIIDTLGRIHYADPVTSAFRTAEVPDEQLIKGGQLVWSSDHRYLLSGSIQPSTELSVSLPTSKALQVGPSLMPSGQQLEMMQQHSWQLHDIVSGIRLADLPAPATKTISLAVRNENYNSLLLTNNPKSTPVFLPDQRSRLCRRLLRVDQIYVNEVDNQVAYRDASGGVVCFSLGGAGVDATSVTSHDLGLGFEARLTAATKNLVAISDGRKLAVAKLDDPRAADVKQLRRNRASMIRSILLSEDGSQVVALDDQGSINIWSVETRRLVKEFDNPNVVVAEFLNRNGTRLAMGTAQGNVVIWDLEKDRIAATIQSHAGAVIAMKALPSKDAFVTTGEDSTIQFLDSVAGNRLHQEVFYSSETATRLIATPDETEVLAVGGQSALRFSFAGRVIRKLDEFALPHTVQCEAFHPKADRLLISDSRTVSILDAATGRRLFSFPAHSEAISLLRFENEDTLSFIDSAGKVVRRVVNEKG